LTSYGVLGRSLDSIEISSSTLVYGLVGDPVDHSLSPAIQNTAFRSVGLNAVYLAFPVGGAKLRWAIQGLKSLKVKGFNVTTPHKLVVLRYLDEVDTEAAEIGSINTVKNEEDTLIGFNTDGIGALNAMEAAGILPDGRSVLLLGAGGAGRVIAYALAGRGCSLKLANRTVPTAKRLAKSLHRKFGLKMKVIPLSKNALKDSVNQADVILNASSMGMDGKHNPPIDKRWIRGDHWVFDIVYRPVRTKLLEDAASAGARTITGLDMLVNQGACSFTVWTGKKAPIGEMRRVVSEKLILENATRR
jgi:shikimate dehydrogenase